MAASDPGPADAGADKDLTDLRDRVSTLTQFPRQGLVSLTIFPTPALKTPQGNDEREHYGG